MGELHPSPQWARQMEAGHKELQAELDRLRAEVEKQTLIAESFKQAALDIAANYQTEVEVLWNVIEASND